MSTAPPGDRPGDPPGDRPGDRPARRLSPLTPVVRSSILVAAVVVSSWDDLLRGNLGPLGWLLLALLVGGLVYGTASWLRTTYWIEQDELRVDTGVISRQSRRIRVDRLQGIDVVQPFVARLFGLAEVRMDVAGGGSREGSLAFLPLREAEELRETLLERRDRVQAGRAVAVAGGPDGPGVPDGPVGRGGHGDAAGDAVAPVGWPTPRPERQVARLDLATLLVSLLLSVETVLFLVAAVALGVLFVTFGSFAGLASLVPVVLGFGGTQLRKLVAYHGFTVTSAGSPSSPTLRIRRGLLERDTQTVPLARVQGVVVAEPLLWRGLGWARLDVAVAGEQREREGRPAASTVMPVAPRAEVLALARMLLVESGGPDPDAVPLRRPPGRARWVAPVSRRFLAVGVDERLVVSRQGLLTRRTHAVPLARVQSLQLHQGVWQRRLGLADVRVDSPPGPVGVRGYHRDAAEARQLVDQLVDLTRRARSTAPVS